MLNWPEGLPKPHDCDRYCCKCERKAMLEALEWVREQDRDQCGDDYYCVGVADINAAIAALKEGK